MNRPRRAIQPLFSARGGVSGAFRDSSPGPVRIRYLGVRAGPDIILVQNLLVPVLLLRLPLDVAVFIAYSQLVQFVASRVCCCSPAPVFQFEIRSHL